MRNTAGTTNYFDNVFDFVMYTLTSDDKDTNRELIFARTNADMEVKLKSNKRTIYDDMAESQFDNTNMYIGFIVSDTIPVREKHTQRKQIMLPWTSFETEMYNSCHFDIVETMSSFLMSSIIKPIYKQRHRFVLKPIHKSQVVYTHWIITHDGGVDVINIQNGNQWPYCQNKGLFNEIEITDSNEEIPRYVNLCSITVTMNEDRYSAGIPYMDIHLDSNGAMFQKFKQIFTQNIYSSKIKNHILLAKYASVFLRLYPMSNIIYRNPIKTTHLVDKNIDIKFESFTFRRFIKELTQRIQPFTFTSSVDMFRVYFDRCGPTENHYTENNETSIEEFLESNACIHRLSQSTTFWVNECHNSTGITLPTTTRTNSSNVNIFNTCLDGNVLRVKTAVQQTENMAIQDNVQNYHFQLALTDGYQLGSHYLTQSNCDLNQITHEPTNDKEHNIEVSLEGMVYSHTAIPIDISEDCNTTNTIVKSTVERDSLDGNNEVVIHNTDEAENRDDTDIAIETVALSASDRSDNKWVRVLQEDLNIQERDEIQDEDALEIVDMRNVIADPPNHQYDSLVSIADSGYGSEQGHRGNVICDLNSIRNGRRVTRQNCPICRYRRTHGNMPQDQQLSLYVPDEEGDTSLMLAITFTEIHLAKCLIEQSPSPQQLDIQNRYYLLTALHHAVIAERSDIIRYLLAHGADPTVKDKDGNTALHMACSLATNENIILIKALTVPLSCGLENFRYAQLHSIPQETTLFNYDGETVLHIVAGRGNTRAINFLIGPYFRINLNIQEATAGYTILHNAIIQANKALIRHVLTLPGIDIEAESFAGQTPLELAEVYELQDIVVMLIAYGARIRDSTVTHLSNNDGGDSTVTHLSNHNGNSGLLPPSIPALVASESDCIEVNYETTFKEFEDHAAWNSINANPNMTPLMQDDISYSVKYTDTKTNEKTYNQDQQNCDQTTTTNVLDILHNEESATSFDEHQNSVMGCLNGRQEDIPSKSCNVQECNTQPSRTTHACQEEGDYDEDRDMLLISGMSVALRGQYDFW